MPYKDRLLQHAKPIPISRNLRDSFLSDSNPLEVDSTHSVLFFKAWIGVTHPAVFAHRIGLHQTSGWPLHRVAQLLEQFAHMPRMIFNVKFLRDDAANHGRGPDARFQSIGHRSTVQNVLEFFLLGFTQGARPTTAVTFQQTRLTSLIPVLNPQRDTRSMHLEDLGDSLAGVTFNA